MHSNATAPALSVSPARLPPAKDEDVVTFVDARDESVARGIGQSGRCQTAQSPSEALQTSSGSTPSAATSSLPAPLSLASITSTSIPISRSSTSPASTNSSLSPPTPTHLPLPSPTSDRPNRRWSLTHSTPIPFSPSFSLLKRGLNHSSTGSSSSSSSRPLSHSVLRSLPLGSMVALGHQKSDSIDHKPRKLNQEAASESLLLISNSIWSSLQSLMVDSITEYDAEADALVAGLFNRSESSLSIPSQSSSSSRSHKESTSSSRSSHKEHKEKDESSSHRLRFPRFHRSTNYDKPSPTPTIASSSSSTHVPSSAPIDHHSTSTSSNNNTSLEDDSRGRTSSSKRLSARSMSPFFARNGRSRSRVRSPSPERVEALRGRAGTSEVADSDSDEGVLTESEAGDTLHHTASGGTVLPHSPLPSDDEDGSDGEEEEEDFWDEQVRSGCSLKIFA